MQRGRADPQSISDSAAPPGRASTAAISSAIAPGEDGSLDEGGFPDDLSEAVENASGSLRSSRLGIAGLRFWALDLGLWTNQRQLKPPSRTG